MSQDEARRLLGAAKAGVHWYPLFRIALTTGMREGELFALTVANPRLAVEHDRWSI